MAKTERRVEDLVGDGEEMADALSAVLAVADEKGTVSWGDVSDDLSSGEWGRLIESGLLVDADGDGFVLDDPEGVREALSEAEPAESEEKDLSWSRRDKLAGLGVLLLFLAYSQQGLRDVIAGDGINLVLGPLNATLPFHVVVLILALATGLWTAVLQDNMMDTSIMSDYQETQQEFKEKIEEAKERGDDERVKELRQEQMEEMDLGVFKAQFRPMVWIMLLTIPVFLWIYWMVLDGHVIETGTAMVLPLVGEVSTWQTAVVGPIQLWLVWYFVCSLSFSQIMRKALNVQVSPTGT
ncbi:DUF106 domain-containing protein [Salinirussus salinus]|jgi:uncharacterized membrane protein (DUF106 family)|uniref:DUF106 domain-containing protein n=1 Tax=Salinirussus salinus TaxID=1198300 RepID=UPI0013599CF3|nr:DUF106 domain-containing protein [Salinirussus salinus]